jgi:hypothetical protein
MNKARFVNLQWCLAIWLVAPFSCPAFASAGQKSQEDRPMTAVFFDVSELPARIDEPRLRKDDKEFVLDCAVANRSGEQLLGIRLILLVIDPAGKLRGRITWTERADVAMYSIKTFAFHPQTTLTARSTDQLFLGIDEVIGRETIWRAAGAEKALRAYSRGQHDVVPTVRTFANKYDPRPGVVVVPMLERKQ